MSQHRQAGLTRRQFIWTSFSGLVSFILAACGRQATPLPTAAPATQAPPTQASVQPAPTATQPAEAAPTEAPQILPSTPACGDADDVTPAQTEGPYYTPDTPERTSLLEAGTTGTPLTVTGYVLSTQCQPVGAALLDFWHCDDQGVYDNVGYRLRGHQFADDQGRFHLETIVPGLYPGRTRHIHVKVQAPNQPVLTTQLYFPDEPDNARDGIYSPDLLMDVHLAGGAEAKQGTFNFVLSAG